MHSLSVETFGDIITLFNLRGVVDGTPGAGLFALAAIRAEVPYLGLC